MRTRFLQLWINLHTSYWFIPTAMAVGALVLAGVMLWWDAHRAVNSSAGLYWLYVPTPEGARELLATIAGSMITVAGVTFAITIAALVQAAYQFSPRLLTNFMRDRGNQTTLGTFIATFLYCLLVMRGIQSPAEGPGGFTPHRAVLLALVLTLASVAFLIYYIHHIPQSIHISNVLAQIGHELEALLDRVFPEPIGVEAQPTGKDASDDLPVDFADEARGVLSLHAGYIQAIDPASLLAAVCTADAIVRLEARPGDFINRGQVLARVWPPARTGDQVLQSIRQSFAIGRQRTPDQDVMFLVDEFVEIAGRALSPGQNDPFTAIACLDWLGNAVIARVGRRTPSSRRLDEDGRLRVVAEPLTVRAMVSGIFDALRPYVATDRNAGIHAARLLVELLAAAPEPHHDVLHVQGRALLEAAARNGWYRRDLEEMYAVLAPFQLPAPEELGQEGGVAGGCRGK